MGDRTEYYRQWRAANQESIAARMKAYRQANRERLRAQKAAYNAAHPRVRVPLHPPQVRRAKKVPPPTRELKAPRWGWRSGLNGEIRKRINYWAANVKHRTGEKVSADVRVYVAAIAKDPCAYCGGPRNYACIDHIVPVSAGGRTEIANIAPCCTSCNAQKADRPLLRFLAEREHVSKAGRWWRRQRDMRRERQSGGKGDG